MLLTTGYGFGGQNIYQMLIPSYEILHGLVVSSAISNGDAMNLFLAFTLLAMMIVFIVDASQKRREFLNKRNG